MAEKLYRDGPDGRVEIPKDEADKLRAMWAKNEEDAAASKYKRDREAEYPDWRAQLDQIYHEGLDAWKASIKSIKDNNPKP